MFILPSKNTYGGVIIVNKNYVKGANFERNVKKFYENLGYFVIRSSGSHGVADLVAFPHLGNIKEWQPILIQCKSGKTKINPEDEMKLRDIAMEYGLRAMLIKKVGGYFAQSWVVEK